MFYATLLFLRRSKRQPGQKLPIQCFQAFFVGLLMVLPLSACSLPGSTPAEISGNITIAGSTALYPLASQAATLFQKQHPKIHIDVKGIGSIKGLQAVTSKQTDIGTSDIYADPAVYPDPNLTDHIVCVIPFTMVVNPDVTISALTPDDIINIFSTRKYTNWNQIKGGPDLQITPIVRPPSSGTRDTFRKYVLNGRDENAAYTPLDSDSSSIVLKRVATTPGAIGYLALSVADSTVHKIALNGVQPNINTISKGAYNFWSYEHMYTMGDDNKAIAEYLNFMLTTPIQQLAQRLNYIPISSMNIPSYGSANRASDPSLPTIAYHESEATHRELF